MSLKKAQALAICLIVIGLIVLAGACGGDDTSSQGTLQLIANQPMLSLQGATQTSISFFCRDQVNQPVANALVRLRTEPSGFATLAMPTVLTDAQGAATTTLTALSTAGSFKIIAEADGAVPAMMDVTVSGGASNNDINSPNGGPGKGECTYNGDSCQSAADCCSQNCSNNVCACVGVGCESFNTPNSP